METKEMLDSVKKMLKSKPARIAIGIGIGALVAGIIIKNKIAPNMLEETDEPSEEILLENEIKEE